MIEILKLSLIAFMGSIMIQEPRSLLTWYGRLINKLPWYLCKPLGGCYKCFTGQICLWYFIFTKPFQIVELGFFVSAGIMTSMVYKQIYCFLNEDQQD